MRSRRHYGAHRALLHVAGAIGTLAGARHPGGEATPPVRVGPAYGCSRCDGDHVCPMQWRAVDEDHWRVLSRCGDCGVWTELVLSNAQAAMLDVVLDGQLAQIRAAADRLDGERMADAAAAFAAALRRDLVVAADF